MQDHHLAGELQPHHQAIQVDQRWTASRSQKYYESEFLEKLPRFRQHPAAGTYLLAIEDWERLLLGLA